MNKEMARAKRDEQPPSTAGTSAGRARFWTVAVSVMAIGLVAAIAQVASAEPIADAVSTTAKVATTVTVPEAREARPASPRPPCSRSSAT